jgi:hypothetical protein
MVGEYGVAKEWYALGVRIDCWGSCIRLESVKVDRDDDDDDDGDGDDGNGGDDDDDDV